MFAPQIRKATSKSSAGSRGPSAQELSTTLVRPLNGNTAQHVSPWGIEDKVAGRPFGRETSGSAENDSKGDSAVVTPPRREGTQPAWDFSRIPVFSPEREGQVQGRSLFHAQVLPGVIQTKLVVNEPGDKYEEQAERVAEQVIRMATETVSVQQGHSPRFIQRAPATAETAQGAWKYGTGVGSASSAGIPPSVQTELRSPGQPLNGGTREFMEARFRQDFSKVRLHTSESAAESARAVHARAYTVSDHIVFGDGQYAPGSRDGARLLAHELTHVLQQRNGGSSAYAPESVCEANANSAANNVLGNPAMPPIIVPASINVAREPDENGRKRPKQLIAEANAEIDRLRGIAKQKGAELTPQDAVSAYDAVHSVVLAATAGKDEAFLDQARDVKAKYDSIVRNTPAENSRPFTQHPAASPEPMSQQEASRVVIAQRGFDADLNPQRIQEARDDIQKKRKRLAEIQDQLQVADDATQEKLAAEARKLRNEVAAANSRIAMSRPTLIDADPEQLQAQKHKLEKELAKPETTAASQKKLQGRIDLLNEQIEAPLPAAIKCRFPHFREVGSGTPIFRRSTIFRTKRPRWIAMLASNPTRKHM